MSRVFLLVTVFVFTFCLGGNTGNAKVTLNISAAMATKEPLTKLVNEFEQKHKKDEVKIFLNFAASGQLRAQIQGGAPVDLFVSAHPSEMAELAGKEILAESVRVIEKNELVIIAPLDSKLIMSDLRDLQQKAIKRIALGNFKTVAVGKYAWEALQKSHLQESIAEKIIFGENVRQVVDYVARGEVDVGIVFESELQREKRVKKVMTVPANLHQEIIFQMGIVGQTKNLRWAKQFAGFVSSFLH